MEKFIKNKTTSLYMINSRYLTNIKQTSESYNDNMYISGVLFMLLIVGLLLYYNLSCLMIFINSRCPARVRPTRQPALANLMSFLGMSNPQC